MRLEPLSLLAFLISRSKIPYQRRPTIVFTKNKDVEQAIIEEATANAIKIDSPREQPPNRNSKRSSKSKYNRLTSRQKSISLGNDPIISLNLNLDHLAKSTQNIASATRAEEMLLRIEALHADGYYEQTPDAVSYNCVINAYAHGRGVVDRLGNGERLVQRMKERGIEPNEITYNTLLRCLLKEMEDVDLSNTTIRQQKVEKAESILHAMEELKVSNTRSYNTIISILSKSQLANAPQRSEYWLRRMIEQYYSTGAESIEPDVCSFNSVIHAYANAINHSRHIKNENNVVYAQKAEELLNEMETLYNSGQESVQPDVVSYSTVINAYARAASKDAEWCADKAMRILEKLEKNLFVHKKAAKNLVKPNTRTYSSVINAFARVGNAEAADKILFNVKKIGSKNKRLRLKPDTVCYTSVIDAYAKKGGEDAADRAEELLREMEDLYASGDLTVKPNIRTYCAVINALGKSGHPRCAEKAEQILKDMEYMSSNTGLRDLAPNTICYNAVISAHARSSSVSKAYRTELLLERMIEESMKNGNTRVQPDTITFNSVINAAAQSSVGDAILRKEAYLIALNAFKTLHGLDYCKPSSVTYSSFLKMLQNLVDDNEARDYMARKVYLLSVKAGLDNEAVRLQLKRTCSTNNVAEEIVKSTK